MTNYFTILFFILFLAGCNSKNKSADAQPENAKGFKVIDSPTQPGNWFIQDPVLDQIEGVSSVRAIRQFNLTHPREIIVAVLDSGVDITHPDLRDHIWTNPGETGADVFGNSKESNQVDDDGNGFIDDVHGWNFIGSVVGEHLQYENFEVTRELVRLEKKLQLGQKLTEAVQVWQPRLLRVSLL